MFEVEMINDSGAGRRIGSTEALQAQGVPTSFINKLWKNSSNPLHFATGAGDVHGTQSCYYDSPLTGNGELCHLPHSPLAFPQGEVVEKERKPFTWIPGELPYHVTSVDNIRIICKERHKIRASRVVENVPLFKMQVVLGTSPKIQLAPAFPEVEEYEPSHLENQEPEVPPSQERC